MKPILLLGMIAGSASGLVVGGALGSGLVAPPAPGSIFAFLAVTARGSYVGMLAQVFTAALVSFLVCAALMKFGRGSDDTGTAVGAGSDGQLAGAGRPLVGSASINGGDVRKLVIACDAGMGSSVMVASTMKKRLAPYGVDVIHTPVDQIPEDAQVVLTQEGLAARARNRRPEAVVVPFTNYMGDPAFDQIEDAIKNRLHLGAGAPDVSVTPTAAAADVPVAPAPRKRKKSLDPNILSRDAILLGQHAASKDEAIRQAGGLLVALGATDPSYTDAMFARETQVSTFMGNGVAIPHGTNESRSAIRKAQLGFIQYPGGVDWDGKTCHVCIPIASNSDEHIAILSALASVLADKAKAERLQTTTNIDEVLELLAPEED